jgi:hemoglobin
LGGASLVNRVISRQNQAMSQPQQTQLPKLYDRIGAAKLRAIIQAFYPLVKADPLLSELFPEELSETMNKQEAFLTGFLGGPPLYHRYYGNPMLRARHLKFEITPNRAKAWFECFSDASLVADLEPEVRHELLEAIARMAAHMVNAPQTAEDDSGSQ